MELTLNKANWNCPSVENSKILMRLNQKKIDSFTNLDTVCNIVEENAKEQDGNRYILPVWQNMESIALGTKILDNGTYMIPGRYCVDELSDIEEMDFGIVNEDVIKTVIDAIPIYKDKNLILEIEAPFSVLSAVMNSMDIYVCFMTEPELLSNILRKIADAQADYVKAALNAGIKVISLADPVGTMNMVGEDYYNQFCGESESYFMRRIDPLLDDAIVHICKKMSQSLVIGQFAVMESYESAGNEDSYYDILLNMAADSKVHFTGMTCIHNNHPNLTNSWILKLK